MNDFIKSTYKLDIRDWKQKGKALVEEIDNACRTFTIKHFDVIVLTEKQYQDVAKAKGYYDSAFGKAEHYITDKGFFMEVEINDNRT